MSILFKHQPEACRQALPARAIKARGRLAPLLARVIAYDPVPAFAQIADTANPYSRLQTRREIGLHQLFPKKHDGLCDCGCGRALAGRQRRWAAPECGGFAWYVYAIIAGRREEIRRCLKAYYGRKCSGCSKAPPKYPSPDGRLRSGLEFDHIVPVHKGGGACWLSNYRPLCINCHKAKTAAERRKAPLQDI